jgi:Protein of unknown function (DUF3500)
MTIRRLLLGVAVLAGLASAAWWSRQADWSGAAQAVEDPAAPAGLKMAAAAEKFVGLLNEDQKNKALFAFDDKERTNWNFVPLQKDKTPLRKGLRMDEMTDAEKEAARGLLKTGASDDGYTKAVTIMSLENILRDLEKNGANVRNPEWYFVSIFGKPAKAGKWGWRIEGHHLSLNFTLEDGKVIASTPAFFGANPAEVKDGDRKGLRTLPEAEDYARDLFAALDDDQRKTAFQAKQFPEIEQAKAAPNAGDPVGLPVSKMSEKQRTLLVKLVQAYANRMPGEVASAQMARARDAGVEKIYFAFCREDDKPGKPYTYHVQGPTFLIEFLNVQEDGAMNPANHVHSSWRNLAGDFGLETK